MSTALFELAMATPNRVAELRRLIDHAKDLQDADEALYNSICRAISVLLASHLEGFLKDLTRSLVADLNYYSSGFSALPAALKRAFCEKMAFYEGIDRKQIDDRIRQLIAFFDTNSVPVDLKAITYKEAANKNATSAFIDAAMAKFGIPNITSAISSGSFEVVFDNDPRTDYRLLRDIVRFKSHLYDFPYRELPQRYNFTFRGQGAPVQTLWHAFIEEVMTRRHSVAHGDTLENETTWEDLSRDALKLEVLMHAIMYAAASHLTRSRQS